jgi:hypothetical protein
MACQRYELQLRFFEAGLSAGLSADDIDFVLDMQAQYSQCSRNQERKKRTEELISAKHLRAARSINDIECSCGDGLGKSARTALLKI